MRLQFTNEMFSNKNNNKKQEKNYKECDGNITQIATTKKETTTNVAHF